MYDSIWKPVITQSDDVEGTFSNGIVSIEGLPIAFVELCDITAVSSRASNDYTHIVRLLSPLLRLEPDPENFTKLISFSGRTWPEFRPLLLRKDPRALLLLSYWFALLRQIDQWWLIQRARTECVAITAYLNELRDPHISALLSFPKSFGHTGLSVIWEPLPVAASNLGVVSTSLECNHRDVIVARMLHRPRGSSSNRLKP